MVQLQKHRSVVGAMNSYVEEECWHMCIQRKKLMISFTSVYIELTDRHMYTTQIKPEE